MKRTLLSRIFMIAVSAIAAIHLQTSDIAASEKQGWVQERVILIHGLGRTTHSMGLLSRRLEDAGYEVVRIGYHSLSDDPETIIKDVSQQINTCCLAYPGVTHFVGHSLGGLIIRAYLAQNHPNNLGRVVLLGSPSGGTEVVDNLRSYAWFRLLGPTTLSLGSDLHHYPDRRQAPDYSLGIIAGHSNLISIMNEPLLPGDDDGLVPVLSTKVDGMKDFIVVPATHAGLRTSRYVASQVVHFLQTERFSTEDMQ